MAPLLVTCPHVEIYREAAFPHMKVFCVLVVYAVSSAAERTRKPQDKREK